MTEPTSFTPTASCGASSVPSGRRLPVVLIVVGMAGTGKTSLVHRLQQYTRSRSIRSYFINLDPAVLQIPYDANIDLRDTVSYKEVMNSYRLGPNGAILTSLNLFSTKINEVIQLLETKSDLDWIVVDTPGQIEVFTWSASGQLITEAFCAAFPTMMLFVADTTRCTNPQTFISTMLYSSGIMLKQQVPLAVVFNKTDVSSASDIVAWMKNLDNLDDSLAAREEDRQGQGAYTEPGASSTLEKMRRGDGAGYSSSLVRSMSLFLHEFYENMPHAAVSAATGDGMADLEECIRTVATRASNERAANVVLQQGTASSASAQMQRLQLDLNDDKAAQQ